MRTKSAAFWVSAATSGLLALGAAAPAAAQDRPFTAMDGQFHFVVAPYALFTGVKGDVSVKGIVDIPIDVSFSDVMKDFHLGFLGRFEGRKDRFGFATDLIYLNLHAPVARDRPILGQLDLDTTVKWTTVEGLGFYRAAIGGRKDNPAILDVLVGARYYGMSTQLNATLPGGVDASSTKQTFSWVDGLIGLRFRAPLGSKAAVIGRGDVAGFGSKVTWNLEGDLAVGFSEHWTAGAGWRYMSIDYDKSDTDSKLFNLKFNGPRVWFAYAW